MSEKHKLYFLIVMVLIAGLIAYVRFFRPAGTAGKPNLVVATADRFKVAMPTALEQKTTAKRAAPKHKDTRRHISRNIFEPAGPLPSVAAPTQAATQRVSTEMTLTGTIIGGDAPIAIINHRFMRQGQKLGQYRITRITPDKVYLAAGKDRRCLRVLSVSEDMAKRKTKRK